jgi:hypothetical protein
MITPKPTPQILDEGLTPYLYDALNACRHPTFWKQDQLTHSIASLYKSWGPMPPYYDGPDQDFGDGPPGFEPEPWP